MARSFIFVMVAGGAQIADIIMAPHDRPCTMPVSLCLVLGLFAFILGFGHPFELHAVPFRVGRGMATMPYKLGHATLSAFGDGARAVMRSVVRVPESSLTYEEACPLAGAWPPIHHKKTKQFIAAMAETGRFADRWFYAGGSSLNAFRFGSPYMLVNNTSIIFDDDMEVYVVAANKSEFLDFVDMLYNALQKYNMGMGKPVEFLQSSGPARTRHISQLRPRCSCLRIALHCRQAVIRLLRRHKSVRGERQVSNSFVVGSWQLW